MGEILVISPYPELAEIVLKVIGNADDVDVRVTRMDQAVELALQAEAQGYQVIVSRGLTTSKILKSDVNIPVIDIRISGYDILRAYTEAKRLGDKVGIVDVEDVILGVCGFEKIVGDNLVKYTCKNDLDDIAKGINYLKSQGVNVVIGKIAMAKEARKQGMEALFITSSFETVRDVIMDARRVKEVRKQEERKAQQLKALLNFTYDGIIALDRHSKITLFSKVAEDLSGWTARKAMNKKITEVIPNAGCQHLLVSGRPELGAVFKIGHTKVVGNRVPIVVDNQIEGVVTTFQKLDILQKIESKVRRTLSEKGLTARSRFDSIIGDSAALKNTVTLAKEYAAIDSTILIHGKTGTGKEIFAQAIHNESRRKHEPFIAINCAALPENLLESELFGYVEGAFTGARQGGKAGVFEIAHGGTLMLDEVGEMTPRLQSRFLRVIEQREVMRLGDSRVIPINVRLIAATHRYLRGMVSTGEFREDLFYRLNVLTLPIPQLQDRDDDVILIAEHFLKKFYKDQNKPDGIFSTRSIKILLQYDWPGNIRQLRNVMERLSVMTAGGVIRSSEVKKALQIQDVISSENGETTLSPDQLSRDIPYSGMPKLMDTRSSCSRPLQLSRQKSRHERQLILDVLEECNGNKTEASKKLGISRTTLWRKLRK